MRIIMTRGKIFTTIITLLFILTVQANAQIKKSHFYLGLDVRLASLSSSTSYKTIFGIKGGYNVALSNRVAIGPQAQILFVKSPAKKGALPAFYSGISTLIETSDIIKENKNKFNSVAVNNRLSWIFPLNPAVNNFDYRDCFTITTSIKVAEFYYYKTSLDINVEFQRYDIGFYSGQTHMISLTTGSTGTFTKE